MAASGLTPNYDIPYPLSTDSVSVSGDMTLIAERVDELFSTVPQTITDAAINAAFQVIPLDDISLQFDNIENTFVPRYEGERVQITNPYRVLLTLDGVQQKFCEPEYVYMTPIAKYGFMVDYDGNIRFSPIPDAGEIFDARVLPGSPESEYKSQYPFKAADIIMGG